MMEASKIVIPNHLYLKYEIFIISRLAATNSANAEITTSVVNPIVGAYLVLKGSGNLGTICLLMK